MAEKKVMLTQEGYDELVARLEHLKSVRRIEVADRLKAAIALGDLSENSEYVDAKNEQAFLEGEIVDLEKQIRNAEIIHKSNVKDKVSYGSKVNVTSSEGDYNYTYAFVESTKKGLYIMVYEYEKDYADPKDAKPKYIINKDMVDKLVEKPEVMHWRISNELMQKKVGDVIKDFSKEYNATLEYKITSIVEVVTLGSKVRIRFLDFDNPYKQGDKNYNEDSDAYTYTIVGTTEADPDEGKISDESPLGDALLGQSAGSTIQVSAPRGTLQYTITEIVND